MAQPPKNEIMTINEMDDMNYEILSHSRLYDRDTSASEKVAVTVGAITQQLIDFPAERISLRDANTVKATTYNYLKSCERIGIIPSKIGLSRALGISRTAIDAFVRRNPDSETGRFLSMAFDAFAEMLSANSLSGSVHPIVSIFLQKALYGFRDNSAVIEQSELPEENSLTIEEIEQRYADLPEE